MPYAIKNKKTGRYVIGTDKRYHPAQQFTSDDRALMFSDYKTACLEIKFRGCGKDYIPVEIERVKEKETNNGTEN